MLKISLFSMIFIILTGSNCSQKNDNLSSLLPSSTHPNNINDLKNPSHSPPARSPIKLPPSTEKQTSHNENKRIHPTGSGKVVLVMTVDWEGSSLDEGNLVEMSRFRDDYPEIKILQFLNAAYYTKPNARPHWINEQTRRVIREGDEFGLHIHAWKTLFEKAGVASKLEESMSLGPENCAFDCGHAIPLSAYSQQELEAVIAHSLDILNQNGFGRARSFRAGAWIGSEEVLNALIAENFLLDSSAVPIKSFDHQALNQQYPTLYERLESLWGEEDSVIHSASQPYRYANAEGSLVELPNNGVLADWVTPQEIFEAFLDTQELLAENPNQDVYLTLGFHLETANSFLWRIREAITLIENYARARQIPLEMARFPLRFNNLASQ